MDQENVVFLKEMLKNLGFGEKSNTEMETKIKEQPEKFSVAYSAEFSKKSMEFVLDFKKSETTERYFFNNYEAKLKTGDAATEKTQIFYVGKGNVNVTAKEAFNLLEGRPVHKTMFNKEGEKYQAWVQLNFDSKDKYNNFEIKKYYDSYKFDLKEAVAKHPIKELTSEGETEKLMKSLQKGNLQQVTYAVGGAEEKMYVAANVRYKNLDVYDANMKSIYQGINKEAGQEKEMKQEKKEEKKEAQKQDDESNPTKQTRRKGMTV